MELDELLGSKVRELADRLAAAVDWRECFAALDDVLTRCAVRSDQAGKDMTSAWHRIVESGGTLRIGELAAETGYSRRHLTKRSPASTALRPSRQHAWCGSSGPG